MLAAGTMLGHYQVLEPLGAGGMGEVYRALDTHLGREVALKIILSEFARSPDRIKRFEQEARAAGALNHPHVCTVFDLGAHDGSPYVVMELLEGQSLRARLSQGPIPARKAVEWAAQAAHGLAAVHAKGIVHRDLKPENLFLAEDGSVKVLDFGLAKLTRPELLAPAGQQPVSVAPTETGAVLGTAGYMAPEQVRGDAVDHRADLFALGAILYELLTGQRAFGGVAYYEISYRILNEDPPPLSASGRELPAGLEAIMRRCLEKGPDQRFQSAKDLAFTLESVIGSAAGATVALVTQDASTEPEDRTKSRAKIGYMAAGLLGGVLLMAAIALFVVPQSRHSRVTFKKLSFGKGAIASARFTPDGNSVLYCARWEDRELELFATRVDAPGATPLGLRRCAIVGIRGGEAAVLAWGIGLAKIPVGGGTPRPIREEVFGADWSPDGKSFAVVSSTTGRRRLEYPPGKVLFETAGNIAFPRISPRGDCVAFLHWPYTGGMNGSIMAADTSGNPTTLFNGEGWAAISTPAWSPDGSEIWFTAGRVWGWRSLYAVTLDKKVRTVLEGFTSLDLLDVSRDGRVLLASGAETSEIWGRAPGDTTERSYSWLDGGVALGLSRDGTSLLFVECSAGGGVGESMFLRRFDGSLPMRLRDGGGYGLSPDGAWAIGEQGSTHFLVPTGAGEARPMPRGSVDQWQSASFFADGTRLLIGGSEAGRPQRLFVQDLAGGPPRPVSAEGTLVPNPSAGVSPDGTQIAAISDDGPILIPVAGGEPRRIEGLVKGEQPLAWTRDGRALFVREVGRPTRVVRFDLVSRQKTLWREFRLLDPSGASITYQPLIAHDGDVYFYTVARQLNNLFLVEGLR